MSRVVNASGDLIDAADVFFARSTDYGVTWRQNILVGVHPGIILNDDNDARSEARSQSARISR